MTVTLRVYTGTNAGTESDAQTEIALLSTDSAGVDPDAAEVIPGTNSYEKWMRVKIDDADDLVYTNFWIEREGDLPDGVEIRIGVTDTPATPVATTSLVATHEFQSGRRFTFDANSYDEDGQATRYLVIQEQVASDAASGPIAEQDFTIGYQS